MAKSFASLLDKQVGTSSGKSDARRKLMGAVHAAAKRWGKDDDERKAIQLQVTGKTSLTEMTMPEIGKVLDRLNADRPAGSANPRPHVGKIRALWWTLYWLGEIDSPNDAALDGFVTRQTGIASLRFLDPRRAPAVIEALKSRIERAGVRPVDPKLSDEGSLEREEVIGWLWDRLLRHGIIKAYNSQRYLMAALNLSPDRGLWSNRDLDECIKLLGKRWRGHLAKTKARAADPDAGRD